MGWIWVRGSTRESQEWRTVVSVDILLDFSTDLFLRVKSPQNSISRSLLLSVRLRKGMTHDGGVDAE